MYSKVNNSSKVEDIILAHELCFAVHFLPRFEWVRQIFDFELMVYWKLYTYVENVLPDISLR
jgi:hypothetical protein